MVERWGTWFHYTWFHYESLRKSKCVEIISWLLIRIPSKYSKVEGIFVTIGCKPSLVKLNSIIFQIIKKIKETAIINHEIERMLLTINGGKCQGNIIRVREYGLWIMVLCNEKLGIFEAQQPYQHVEHDLPKTCCRLVYHQKILTQIF